MKYIYLFFTLSFLFSCKKENLKEVAKPIVFEKYAWNSTIDSLSGQYFQGVNSDGEKVYVNIWKGWNGGNQTELPATLISADFGKTWKQVADNSGLPRTWTYIESHKDLLFAGTPDRGLFKSADNGNNWQQVTTNNWEWPNALRSNDSRLVVSDFRHDRTYISSDDGNSWQSIYPKFFTAINIDQNSILAIRKGIIIESRDWGNNWVTDNSLVIQLGEEQGSIGVSRMSDTLIAALQNGIFFKRTNSLNWTKISNQLKNTLGIYFKLENRIVVQEQISDVLYYTDDFGKTWKSFNQGIIRGRIFNISKSGKYLLASGEYGFFKRQIEE